MAQIRRSRPEWLKLIAEWRAGGRSPEQFCAKRGIRPGTFKWWVWKIDAESSPSTETAALVPVTLSPAIASTIAMFEVELRDVRFRFETGTDPAYVAAVVREIGLGTAAW